MTIALGLMEAGYLDVPLLKGSRTQGTAVRQGSREPRAGIRSPLTSWRNWQMAPGSSCLHRCWMQQAIHKEFTISHALLVDVHTYLLLKQTILFVVVTEEKCSEHKI